MNTINLVEWVHQSPSSEQKELRQAVHTILSAIANEPRLQSDMIIKGGILLAIRFDSSRYTRDIDFSTHKTPGEVSMADVRALLENSLSATVETLNYELDCRVQSCKMNPASPKATTPTMQMTIGYAYKGSDRHKRLLRGESPVTVAIDYSLNEVIARIDTLNLHNQEVIRAYALSDLVAEKLRSMLQQKDRQRTRRQDVYDVYLLLQQHGDQLRAESDIILDALLQKSHARNLQPGQLSLRDEEIRSRSRHEYLTLADEIQGELPDFETAYTSIQDFYESLNWEK